MATLHLYRREIDLQRRMVVGPARTWRLSPIETKLLSYLASAPGRVISRDELLERVWGYRRQVRTRTVQSTIHRLRTKIEEDAQVPRHLITVYGMGYRFELTDPAPVPPPPGTRQVRFPLATRSFIGREREIEQLREALATHRIVGLQGLGGLGKSRLAQAYVERYALAWPDGVTWVDVDGMEGAESFLATVAGSWQLTGQSDVSTDLGLALQQQGRHLVVLDGVEGVAETVDAHLERWTTVAPEIRWLITSRVPLALAHPLAVRTLPHDEGVALLKARTEAHVPGWAHEVSTVKALATLLDGMPLALELAAGHAPAVTAEELLDRLSRSMASLTSSRGGRHLAVADTLAWSVTRLPAPLRTALSQAAVFEGGFGWDAAVAVIRVPMPSEEVLRQLVERGFLTRISLDGRTRFRLPSPIREAVIGSSTPPEDAQHRAAGHYAARFREALPRLGAAERAAEEWSNLVNGLRYAVQRQTYSEAVHLAWGLGCWSFSADQLRPMLSWLPVLRTHDAALTQTARVQLRLLQWLTSVVLGADPKGSLHLQEAIQEVVPGSALEAYTRTWWARTNGAAAEEELERAETVARKLDRPALLSFVLQRQATFRVRQRDWRQAQRYAQEATRVAEDHGLRTLAFEARTMMASALVTAGELEAASVRYGELVTDLDDAQDPNQRALLFGQIAHLEQQRGRVAEMIGAIDQAASWAARSGNRLLRATFLADRGAALHHAGRLDEAVPCYLEALVEVDGFGYLEYQALVRLNLGWARLHEGALDEAERLLTEALAVAQEFGDRTILAVLRGTFGSLELARGGPAQPALATAAETLAGNWYGTVFSVHEAWARASTGDIRGASARLRAAAAAETDPIVKDLISIVELGLERLEAPEQRGDDGHSRWATISASHPHAAFLQKVVRGHLEENE